MAVARYQWRVEPLLPAEGEAPLGRRNNLPRDVALTGRSEELDRISGTLSRGASPEDGETVLTIDAVDGMPGVGKTALAVHVAHRLAPAFPDAQLFIDLRGYSAGQEPVKPKAALGALLRAMGVPAERIPQARDARQDDWRLLMADKQAVLILDNAKSASQVRPLLPGSPSCRVLVTSRERLTGLAGARPLSLDQLSLGAATGLIRGIVGDSRVTSEPSAAEEVVQLCGYLPLAIQLAANRLRHHSTWTVQSVADELRDTARAWKALRAEDISVLSAFRLSYDDLDCDAQALFTSLALGPASYVSVDAAAALYGACVTRTEDVLEVLYNHHLVQEPSRGKYEFHDLLRKYARDLADIRGSKWKEAALARLCELYKKAAQLMSGFDWVTSAELEWGIRFRSRDELFAWLDVERPSIVSAVRLADELGWDAYVRDIPISMASYLQSRGYTTDALDVHQRAVDASITLGDSAAEAVARENLGAAAWDAGLFRLALDEYGAALNASRARGDLSGRARLLERIGFTHERTGEYEEARKSLNEALVIRRQLGDLYGEAGVHNALGAVKWREHAYQQALVEFNAALNLYERLQDRDAGGASLNNMGLTYKRMGLYDDAMRHLRLSQQVAERLGDVHGPSVVYNNLGFTQTSMGSFAEAKRNAERGLDLARQIGSAYQEARGHDSLGGALIGLGRVQEGHSHLHEAHRLYVRLGVPESRDVERQLSVSAARG